MKMRWMDGIIQEEVLWSILGGARLRSGLLVRNCLPLLGWLTGLTGLDGNCLESSFLGKGKLA